MVGSRGGDADVGPPVGDQRAHDLRVGGHQLDRELLARVEVGQQRRDERLGRRVAGGQAHDGAGLADPDHDLGDLVGGLQQRARVAVQPPPGSGEGHAARRALEQARSDLGLERRQALGQRWLRDAQAHGGASQAAEVGRDAEAAQLVELGGGGWRGHGATIPTKVMRVTHGSDTVSRDQRPDCAELRTPVRGLPHSIWAWGGRRLRMTFRATERPSRCSVADARHSTGDHRRGALPWRRTSTQIPSRRALRRTSTTTRPRVSPAPPAAPASDGRVRQEWMMVGIGLAALVAVLAIVVSVFAFASSGGSGETTTVVKHAAAATPAAAAPAKAPTLADAKGVAFEKYAKVDPDAPGRARRRREEVHRRRLPARHPGRPQPRAHRGVELRRQRQGLPRHRRQPADRRQPGRPGADHLRQRRLEEDGRQHGPLDRLPLRRGRAEQELHRRRSRQEADDRLRRQAPRRVHVPLRHAAGAHAHERRA